MSQRWWQRSDVRAAAGLAVAAAMAATAAMLIAKAACVLSVIDTPVGSSRLSREVEPGSLPPWFGFDLVAALVWGALVGALCGFAERRLARRVAAAALVALNAALALALFLSVYVYAFWGTPPTWQLMKSLDDPDNAADSVGHMITAPRVALLGLLLVTTVGGTLALVRWFRSRPRAVPVGAAAMVVLTGLLLLPSLTQPSGRFELERSPLLAFASSAVFEPTYAGDVAARAGEWSEVLASVSESAAEATPGAYDRLAHWTGQRRPNVVFVILETMAAAHHLQLTGGPVANTPNLSRLAERGILWPRHYAHTPSSMFAIYQLLCSNHGDPAGDPITLTRPRIDCRSLSEILVERGYRAGLFHSGRHSYSRKDRFLAGRGYDVLYDTQSMPHRERYQESSWGIEERASIDALLSWVAEDRTRPFLATYIPVYPHHPYKVPDPKYNIFRGKGGTNSYRNCVYYVDQMIGELVDRLDQLGVADDTLFVFVGDHGEGFGEHPGSKMHGSKLYDEASRTFALWYAPGALGGAARDPRPLGHVDVVPTLLDLLDIEPPASHVGASAASPAARPMVPLYTGYGVPLVGFVDGRYKYILNRRSGHAELYDLVADPGERRSLVQTRPRLGAAYKQRAAAFVKTHQRWQEELADLPPPRRAFEGTDHAWTVSPASCRFPPANFEVVDGQLRTRVGAEVTVVCETTMPAPPGVVTGMTVRGHEAINGGFITAMAVWIGDSGRRRLVAYCRMNGSEAKPASGCEADLVPESSVLEGGGKVVLELRYVTKLRDVPLDIFSVSEVELRYRVRDE